MHSIYFIPLINIRTFTDFSPLSNSFHSFHVRIVHSIYWFSLSFRFISLSCLLKLKLKEMLLLGIECSSSLKVTNHETLCVYKEFHINSTCYVVLDFIRIESSILQSIRVAKAYIGFGDANYYGNWISLTKKVAF